MRGGLTTVNEGANRQMESVICNTELAKAPKPLLFVKQ